jgi:N-acetylmuramoyl-L-alanine amidase
MNRFQDRLTALVAVSCLLVSQGCSRAANGLDACVVLDAGHGGRDAGAVYAGVREKDLTLRYSEALAERLSEFLGPARVEKTRTGDTTQALYDRRLIRSVFPRAIFLSLHVDASLDEVATGTRIFYSAYSTPAEGYRSIGDAMNDLERYENANQSRHLARRLARAFQSANRKAIVLPGTYYVLADGRGRDVLVELGFLSSPFDRSLLVSQEFLDSVTLELATALAAECG